MVKLILDHLINFYNFSAEAEREDAQEMMTHITDSKELAEKAVSDGDDTLKKAKNTFQLLQSFQSEVQNSSERAKVALQDVTGIAQQITNTEEIIQKAEEVFFFLLLIFK